MKVNHISQNDTLAKNTPNFKGGGDAVLRYLATNQAVGANGVDLCFMVIPRTTSDLVRRGPDAGLETGRREAMGTVNDSLIGVYGIGAGALVSAVMGMNKKFGAKVNQMMAAPETINILAENKARQLMENKSQLDYLKETLKNVKAYNPTAAGADADGFVRISEETINKVAEIMDKAITDEKMSFKEWSKKGSENSLDVVINLITEKTGAQSKYILEGQVLKDVYVPTHIHGARFSNGEEAKGLTMYTKVEGTRRVSETNLKTLLEDTYKLSEAFNKPEVQKSFREQIANGKGIADNKFIKGITKFGKIKSIAGFGIAAAVGLSVQPINMYLTKKKTGSDGFVGVEGRTKDTSKGFFAAKVASAVAFSAMILKSIGTGLSGFMDKMAFKGFWPTINQLKGVFGITIISRIFSARDKDELRESLTKDTLGFLSWLILGDIVNKMTAEALDKSVMNRTKDVEKEGWFKRIFHSSLKTRDEILLETLSANGVETVKNKDGKLVAKTFRELEKELEKLPEAIRKQTKKRLSTLNKAQVAGYMFSGLVLGLGIPNLNIAITNALDKKRKAKTEAEAQKQEVKA